MESNELIIAGIYICVFTNTIVQVIRIEKGEVTYRNGETFIVKENVFREAFRYVN